MPIGARRLLAVGIVLTLSGLIGSAALIGRADAGGLVKWVFMPLYALGAACMIGSGVWWLKAWSRR